MRTHTFVKCSILSLLLLSCSSQVLAISNHCTLPNCSTSCDDKDVHKKGVRNRRSFSLRKGCQRLMKLIKDLRVKNIRHKCEYKSDFFTQNMASFYNKCTLGMQHYYHLRNSIVQGRFIVHSCIKGFSKSYRCSRYVVTTMAQIRKSRSMGCGYSNGSTWSPRRATHRRWCLQLRGKGNQISAITSKQILYRSLLLNRCGVCKDYAKTAVQQFQVSRRKQCGYGPNDRWSNQYSKHFWYCKKLIPMPTEANLRGAMKYHRMIRANQLRFNRERIKRKRMLRLCQTMKTYRVCFKIGSRFLASSNRNITVNFNRCMGPAVHTLVDGNGGTLRQNDVVYIRTSSRRYWSVTRSATLATNRTEPDLWEAFRIRKVAGRSFFSGGSIALYPLRHSRSALTLSRGVISFRRGGRSKAHFQIVLAGRSVGAPPVRLHRHGVQSAAVYAPHRRNGELFYQRGGFLAYRYSSGRSWRLDRNSFRRGGRSMGSLTAVYAPQRRHSEAYYIGRDGYLRFFYVNRGRWQVDQRSFRRGGKLAGPLSAIYASQRRHSEVFARGRDGYLRYFYVNRGWQVDQRSFRSGGRVDGEVAAVYAPHRKHSEVFFRGANGYLRYFFLHRGRWMMDSRTFRGKRVTGSVAAVYHKRNRHSEVWFRGSNGYLNRMYFNRGWRYDRNSWRSGRRVAGKISAVYSDKRGQPSGFYKGDNGYLQFFAYNPRTRRWFVEQRAFIKAGRVRGKISAYYSKSLRHAGVFFQGANGRMYHFYYQRGWRHQRLSY